MASQKPSHRSSAPKPLEKPRTNPLETMSRNCGEVSSKGLSGHFGVQGKIRRRPPKVAHTVTSNKARSRHSQICQLPGPFSGARTEPALIGFALKPGDSASRGVIVGAVFGSTFMPHSRPAVPEYARLDSVPSNYFTPSGLYSPL